MTTIIIFIIIIIIIIIISIIIIIIIIIIELMAHINKPLAKDQLLDIDKFGASSPAFVCLDHKEKRASNIFLQFLFLLTLPD